MKYQKYLALVVLALCVSSFTPPGKNRNPTLPVKDSFGHIHWIQAISYHASMDSSGNIIKGVMINDTDINGNHRPMAKLPIEAWACDEYGNQVEHDKCYANGKLYNAVIHRYYPNGDVEEIIDSTTENGLNVIFPDRSAQGMVDALLLK